jgi:hypothetical protein
MADYTQGTTIQVEAQDTTFSRNGNTVQQMVHSTTDNGPRVDEVYGGVPVVQKPTLSRTAVTGHTYLSALFPCPDYETPTSGLYDRTLAVAYAMAQTGPTAVRGGTARTGIAIAEALTLAGLNRWREIWQAWAEWAKITVESVAQYNNIFRAYDQQTLADNEQYVMAGHAYAQSAVGYLGQINAANQARIQAYSAAKHYGSSTMTTQENLSGQGTQGSAANNAFGSANWR